MSENTSEHLKRPTCPMLPSEHLVAMRDRLKDFVHGGKHFSSEEIASLIRRFNTVIALTEYVEDENRVFARALAARHERASHGRPRLRLVTPDDGGDAA